MKEYNAYLFDADGTLIDTAELIYQCYRHTTTTFGVPTPSQEAVFGSIGLPLRAQIELFFGTLSEERYDLVQAEHMRYQFAHYHNHLRLFPGVLSLLTTLKAKGKPLAVVTSRRIASLEPFLKIVGIWEFFDVIVSPECTAAHKPSPEPVFYALEKLGMSAQECLFVGDATFDIEAGHAAGVDTVFVGWSFLSPADLPTPPTYTVKRTEEILWEPLRS